MIKTKLPPIIQGFSSKHVCPFSQELKSIRNQISKISDEYGNYSTDLQISVYGQSTSYHVKAYNIQLDKTVEAVSNNLKDLEKNLRKSLQEVKENAPIIALSNRIFSKTV